MLKFFGRSRNRFPWNARRYGPGALSWSPNNAPPSALPIGRRLCDHPRRDRDAQTLQCSVAPNLRFAALLLSLAAPLPCFAVQLSKSESRTSFAASAKSLVDDLDATPTTDEILGEEEAPPKTPGEGGEEELPEEDRDLTPEEQIEQLKVMLREGRIGIMAYDKHFTKNWNKVLKEQGVESPDERRRRESLRKEASRKLSRAGTAADLAVSLSGGEKRRTRASRKSKEMYEEQVLAAEGLLQAPPSPQPAASGEEAPAAAEA